MKISHKIEFLKKWLNDPEGVRFSDKFSLHISKILFISTRFLIKIVLGKKKRDEIYAKNYITFLSFLKKLRKTPLLVKNHDGKFWCRPYDSDTLMISDNHEDFLQKKIEAKKNDIVIDIGANIGKYAIRCGNSVGEQGKVYAIEVEPKTYDILCKNIKLNKLEKRVIPIKLAITDKIGKSSFYVSKGRSDISSIHDKWAEKIEVDTMTIDELIKKEKLTKVNLIQMDIQGAEYETILGSSNSIKNRIIEKFVIETHGRKNFELIPPLLQSYYDIEIFAKTGPDFGYTICNKKNI